MKKHFVLLLSFVLAANLVTEAQITINKPKSKTPEIPNGGLTAQQVAQIKAASGVDLSVISAKAVLISTSDKIHGSVKIEGQVKNTGVNNYVSKPGQQEVVIMEGNKVVARKAFQNLSKGAVIKISYTTKWNIANEFNPDYTVQINFDPDLYVDGNTKNDDKVSTNNKEKLPAVQINAVVSRG